jgi:hypothetical protein
VVAFMRKVLKKSSRCRRFKISGYCAPKSESERARRGVGGGEEERRRSRQYSWILVLRAYVSGIKERKRKGDVRIWQIPFRALCGIPPPAKEETQRGSERKAVYECIFGSISIHILSSAHRRSKIVRGEAA